jgi:hypothetical protein
MGGDLMAAPYHYGNWSLPKQLGSADYGAGRGIIPRTFWEVTHSANPVPPYDWSGARLVEDAEFMQLLDPVAAVQNQALLSAYAVERTDLDAQGNRLPDVVLAEKGFLFSQPGPALPGVSPEVYQTIAASERATVIATAALEVSRVAMVEAKAVEANLPVDVRDPLVAGPLTQDGTFFPGPGDPVGNLRESEAAAVAAALADPLMQGPLTPDGTFFGGHGDPVGRPRESQVPVITRMVERVEAAREAARTGVAASAIKKPATWLDAVLDAPVVVAGVAVAGLAVVAAVGYAATRRRA